MFKQQEPQPLNTHPDEQGDNSVDHGLVRPTLMGTDDLSKNVVEAFKKLYGMHMSEATHIQEVLMPSAEKKKQLV